MQSFQKGNKNLALQFREKADLVLFYCLWMSYLAQASAMAVVLDNMQTALGTWAISAPGIAVGGW